MGLFDKFKKNKEEQKKVEEPKNNNSGYDYEKSYNSLLNSVETLYSKSILQRYGLSDAMTREIVDSVKNFQNSDLDLENKKSDYEIAYSRLAAGTIKLYTNQILQGYGIADDIALDIVNEISGFKKSDLQYWQDSFLEGKRSSEENEKKM